jgi:sugar phosphate isomerase/epimerase
VRFGISTHLYYDQPLGPAHLAELAEFGFRDIELFAARGHFDYREPAAVGALAGWLSGAGLRLHSVHAPIVERVERGAWGRMLSTAAASEEARREAVAECLAALEIARAIPFSFLVVHLGVPDVLSSGADDNSPAAARRSLEEIATAAAMLGVQVAVEVIPNALSAPERLVQLVEDELELPAAGAGICLDMGHAALMGDVADAIDVTSGDLVTTHVHDNRGRRDDHLVPFDGTIDWATALMTLQKVGYGGILLFELNSTATPRESLEKTRAVRERFTSILMVDSVPEP